MHPTGTPAVPAPPPRSSGGITALLRIFICGNPPSPGTITGAAVARDRQV